MPKKQKSVTGHAGYAAVDPLQNDICLFHKSMTLLPYIWLLLSCLSQVLLHRASIKGFAPNLSLCDMSLSVTLATLPIKLLSISSQLWIYFNNRHFLL